LGIDAQKDKELKESDMMESQSETTLTINPAVKARYQPAPFIEIHTAKLQAAATESGASVFKVSITIFTLMFH
jgi:aspartyl/asparaginyl-tRNA synthetase